MFMGEKCFSGGFALIVVLFILLIIVGAAWIC
ncbi:sporulation protein YjcZ [Bacillus halotolerans]|nr:sporulation protein YjcZ [Bacillus halotolerans]